MTEYVTLTDGWPIRLLVMVKILRLSWFGYVSES